MAPTPDPSQGAGGGAVRIVVDQGRRVATRLAITVLTAVAVAVGLVFHVIGAIRMLFVRWATTTRPRPGPLPLLVAVPIRVIDTLDRALCRIANSVSNIVKTLESPLRNLGAASANRISNLERRR